MKKSLTLPLFLMTTIVMLFTTCKDDCRDCYPTPVETGKLVISPGHIEFNDGETVKLFLSVQPQMEVTWMVSRLPDWLTAYPNEGIIKDEIVEIVLNAYEVGLEPGHYNWELDIISNGAGMVDVGIEMYVDAHPMVAASPSQLHFSSEETEKPITIKNTGTGILHWTVASDATWMEFEEVQGSVSGGDSTVINVKVSRDGFPVGMETGEINIGTNAENGNPVVAASMDVPAFELLIANDTSVSFDYFEDQSTLYIKNIGNAETNWSLTIDEPWCSANVTSGNLGPNDAEEISFSINRNGLETNVYNFHATFSYGDDSVLIIPVIVKHYIEEKWLIDGMVTDAEYDRIHDKIIGISIKPFMEYALKKYDPETQVSNSVTLNLSPRCISVSPDGNYAAVGHNGKVTYVNLQTMEIEEIYNVTAEAADIVLASNGWMYVFPLQDQWERIRCIELSTGIETEHTGSHIYDNTRAKLHPSGKYIYGANNGLSPSDFEKYDITGGTAAYMYDSPYHGTYSFGGNIWISDDGTKLFAKSMNVFHATEEQSTDMTYSGALSGNGYVLSLDQHSQINRIYALIADANYWEDNPITEVSIYDSEFLEFLGTEPFPGFLTPDGSGGGEFFVSNGHFGFLNAAGTKYYAIVEAQNYSAALDNYAIVTIDVE